MPEKEREREKHGESNEYMCVFGEETKIDYFQNVL